MISGWMVIYIRQLVVPEVLVVVTGLEAYLIDVRVARLERATKAIIFLHLVNKTLQDSDT